MGIYNLANKIKKAAMHTPLVNMASFGNITEYDNKKTIAYPYVNVDVQTNKITNNSIGTYSIRIECVDRNEPFEAYNKCESILDTLMNTLEIKNYTINYFTLNYQDMVNGCYIVIDYTDKLELKCV